MTAEYVQARAGAYADSVTLMRVSARAQEVAGVQAALVAMATEVNLALLAELGFTAPPGAGPNDLLIAIRADDQDSLAAALAATDEALVSGAGMPGLPGQPGMAPWQPPRTTLSAARRSGPGLALISVPGQHAFAEAMDALGSGCDVMIFSDNVPVEQEIMLKDIAAQRGLLVMGPDCGTAIVAGVGLGFAHSVPPGPIGLVAASGTGAQQVVCLLDAAGAGVSAVLGVGGRDLSAAVGGRSARAALAALDEDPATELIVLVSKPPDAAVAIGIRDFAAALPTPVHFALIGPGQPDLTAATEAALRATGFAVPGWPRWGGVRPDGARRAGAGALRGLFAGGTLCHEAMIIATERLGPVFPDVPQGYAPRHVMIDFGDDELTAGRPHPIIDQRLRLTRLAAEAADPAVAVILLDVVLGHGAHPDPAAELVPAIAAAMARRDDLAFVVSLIGARSDLQGVATQANALARAGAHVFASNAEAARFACDLIGAGGPQGTGENSGGSPETVENNL